MGKFIEIDSRRVGARGWETGPGGLVLIGHTASVLQEENALKMGGPMVAQRCELVTLHLKIVEMVNVMCILLQRKIKTKK